MSLISNRLPGKFLADSLAAIQAALQILLLALIVVCLVIAWWRYQSTVFVISEIKLDTNRAATQVGDFLARNVHPVTFYTDLVEKRDIFRFSVGGPAGDATIPQIVSPVNQDLMARYVVQGIIHDQNPMAIIKDVQGNKTYFLHRSEVLEGAQLVDIRENHVIFNRGGEIMELIKK